jgi:molybdenum cofactor cytidylyltransferase
MNEKITGNYCDQLNNNMIPIVILAAGASSRLGKPKQNLVFKGQTLLQRMIVSASAVSGQVIVVLGANLNEIDSTNFDVATEILYNEDWALGMGSSIRQATSHVEQKYPHANAMLVTVCDQPYVDTALLQQLFETAGFVKHDIVACSYKGTVGVPAVFKKICFPELLKLNGKEGAKKIMEQRLQNVYQIPFPLGSVDIDTEEDFNNLLTSSDL